MGDLPSLTKEADRPRYVERLRAAAGRHQRRVGTADEFLRGVGLQAHGLGEVVGEHLGDVGHPIAARGLDPTADLLVTGRPVGARDLAVGDVADQRMAEDPFVLAFERRFADGADGDAGSKAAQREADVLPRDGQHEGDGPRPEDLASHRCDLQDETILRIEQIEAGGGDRLHTRRQGEVVDPVRRALLDDETDELGGVERVASAAVEEALLGLGSHQLAGHE